MSQQTPARVIGDRDFPELGSVDVRDAIEASESFVHERVVGVEQSHDALVFEHDALKEHFGLTLHRFAKVVIEVRVDIGVGLQSAQIAQEKPLTREVASQRSRSLVPEHAANLLLENGGLAQAAGCCEVEQLVVRDAAPEE